MFKFKCISVLIILVLTSVCSYSLNNFWYGSLTFNSSGQLQPELDGTLDVQVFIYEAGSQIYYEEHHGVSTDIFSIFSIKIGTGSSSTGLFSAINLTSNTTIILKTKVGASAYTTIGGGHLFEEYQTASGFSPNSAWRTIGNIETNPSFDFIGTTDNQSLVFKTNGTTGMTLKSDGDLDIVKSLSLGGNLSVNGIGTLGWGDEMNHVAVFENTSSTNADGIAIKINNNHTGEDNNFITFYNGSNTVTGRIEGYQHQPGQILQYFEDMKPAIDFISLLGIDFSNMFQFNESFLNFGSLPSASLSGGSLPSLSIDFTALDFSFHKGSFPSLNFSPGSLPSIDDWSPLNFSLPTFNPNTSAIIDAFQPLVCLALENDWKSLLQMDLASLATFAARMELESICKNDGVTYGSKGADYAEWLPKLDTNEKFIFGQIVGVFGGKISLKTEGADQIMSISLAPVIIGNIPSNEDFTNYEKVGFIGQLPVIVRGHVAAGDYIIPSGLNDGSGIAVSEKDLKVEHLYKILGRALESSKDEKMDVITVLIGVKTNEWAGMFKKQDDRITKLEDMILKLSSQIIEMKSDLGRK